MTIDYAYFVAHFPEFAVPSGDQPALQTRIDILTETAMLYVNEAKWGDAAKFAEALYVAHLMKSGENTDGHKTSERVGDLAETFSEDTKLDGTSYGQEFRRLRSATIQSFGYFGSSLDC